MEQKGGAAEATAPEAPVADNAPEAPAAEGGETPAAE